MKRTILLLILGVFCAFNMKAQRADSIRISLLTCASGGEIYSLFGHTAIRYENFTRNIDAVFNYGMFNFNAPQLHSPLRFGRDGLPVRSYQLRALCSRIQLPGRDVWQQTLNLTPDEKEHLFNLLQENYRPENREYRYNFFYDNCATRPRDQIEKAIDGSLQYADNMTDNDTGISFRDLLHKYSEGHPWSRFGMDMCMGSEADKPINRRLMMFVPFYVQEYFNTAQIINKEGKARPLVSSEEKIVETGLTAADHRSGGITPMQSALLLFIPVTAATIYGIRRQKTLWGPGFNPVLLCRNSRMYPYFPGFVLPTSGSKPQLFAVCIPPVAPILPPVDDK